MIKGWTMRLIPALMMAGFAGVAGASGFAVQNQNGAGTGNAFAGAAAVAEDASTIYFNPAGMTYLPQGHSISLAGTVLHRSINFDNKGTGGLVGGAGTDGGDAGGLSFIPAGYYAYAISPDLRVGLGVSPTFGNTTEYDETFVGRRAGYMSSMKQININPSLAYRLSDKISFGFGLNFGHHEIEMRQKHPNGAGVADIRIKGEDTAGGWNIGAMFQPSASTRIGLSYRSKMKFDLDGTMWIQAAASLRDVKAKLEMPDSASMAVTQKLSDRWEMMGDVTWTGWDSVQSIVVRNALTPTILSYRFKDTWRLGLGANYKLNDKWKMRFGVAFDKSPVRDDSDRTMTLPDSDRTWLAIGAKWNLSPVSSLDIGYSHIFFRSEDTARAVRGGGVLVQTVRGSWDNSANILSVQYNHTF